MSENNGLEFTVRQMQVKDLDQVRKIWNLEDFLESIYSNDIMIKLDPQGFFVAEDNNTGELIGVCSGVNLSQDFAFIGQYAVPEVHQGKGIGSALWKATVNHIGHQRNIGLLASPNMFTKYRDRSNFTVIPDRLLHYYSGRVDCNLLIDSIDGITIVPIDDSNIEKVVEYDKQICGGFDRTLLIRETAKVDKREYVNGVAINQNNEVLGYCVVCITNFDFAIVEPLYADNERIAELLLRKCCEGLPITQTIGLIYCCWGSNCKSVAIANKLGFNPFKNRRLPIMFTKKSVDGDLKRIFAANHRAFYPC